MNGHRRGVLVAEDGGAPHALAAVRALGRAGWRAGVAVPGGDSRSARSRWTAAVHDVPRPEQDPDAYVDAIAACARTAGYDVVLAADDIELVALSAGRDRLPCAVPHAPHADLLRAIDKLELTRAAARAGLDAPATVPATPAELDRVDGPVVVKARLHWFPGLDGDDRHVLARRCADRREAAETAARMAAAGRDPVLQEAVEGELMAITSVLDRESRPVAWCQQRTLRQSLRRTSCRAETVPLDEDLAGGVERLLRELGWVGLANLQFLRPPGGRPKLIDLNGRLYGSLALAIAAGVNLPDLWARVGTGAPLPEPVVGRPGARFEALGDDLERARSERSGGLARDLADVAGAALRAAPWREAVRDPAPAADLLRERVARRLGR